MRALLGGGVGSGTVLGAFAGAGGRPSPGANMPAMRGQGFGAGGAGKPGTSNYNDGCGGSGGTNGGNGETVGGCGGGGGGAGGLVIPGFNSPPSGANPSGADGLVWISF